LAAIIVSTSLPDGAKALDSQNCAQTVNSDSMRTFCVVNQGKPDETIQITSDFGGPQSFERVVVLAAIPGVKSVLYSRTSPDGAVIQARVDFVLGPSGKIKTAYVGIGGSKVLEASDFDGSDAKDGSTSSPAVDVEPVTPGDSNTENQGPAIAPDSQPASAQWKAAIASFEKMGGRGFWFSAQLPSELKGGQKRIYLIQSLPTRASERAEILLLRNERTLTPLRKVLADGALLILGEIPLETQIKAAVIPESSDGTVLARAAAFASRSKPRAALFLNPETDYFTLAHESRHWYDMITPDYEERVASVLGAFQKKHSLDPKLIMWIAYILREYRGHLAQYLQAHHDLQNKLPAPELDGSLTTDSSMMESSYRMEMALANQFFEQRYMGPGAQIRQLLGEEKRQELLKFLKEFDLPTPSGTLLNKPRLERIM
jgi:hypothetical protein